MTDIDYTQFKIVGVVEAQPNTKHAIINAVGYLGSDWKFTPLSPTEAKQVFPSRGRVFAPGFQDRYKELIGKCIFAISSKACLLLSILIWTTRTETGY